MCAQAWHDRYRAQVIRAERFQPYSKHPNASGEAELLRIKAVCYCCTLSLDEMWSRGHSKFCGSEHKALQPAYCCWLLAALCSSVYVPKQLVIVLSCCEQLAVYPEGHVATLAVNSHQA